MKKRIWFLIIWVAAALISAMALPQAQAQEKKKESPTQVLITNVRIFEHSGIRFTIAVTGVVFC
jgi:hypothetical protein